MENKIEKETVVGHIVQLTEKSAKRVKESIPIIDNIMNQIIDNQRLASHPIYKPQEQTTASKEAILCANKEERQRVLEKIEREYPDLRWINLSKLTSWNPFDVLPNVVLNNEVCILLGEVVSWFSINEAKEEGYTIIPAEEYLGESKVHDCKKEFSGSCGFCCKDRSNPKDKPKECCGVVMYQWVRDSVGEEFWKCGKCNRKHKKNKPELEEIIE